MMSMALLPVSASATGESKGDGLQGEEDVEVKDHFHLHVRYGAVVMADHLYCCN